MIKTFFSVVLLLALCSARLTIPIRQRSTPNTDNVVQADDEQSSKTLKLTVNNARNEFYGELYVGESSKFSVLFETASDDTWLPDYSCTGCPSQTGYNCKLSSTCDRTDIYATLNYAEGEVTGYLGHDMIGVTQDLKVKSQVLWAKKAHRYNSSFFGFDGQVDGFLGLGSNQSSIGYIDLAYQQNYIQDKVFSFTVDYNLNAGRANIITNTSYLSVGYIPEDKVNKLTWVSLNSGSNYSWAIPVLKTKVGDKIVDTSSELYSNEVSIESGAQGLYLARSIVQELSSQLEKFKSSNVDGNIGPYYICNDNYLDEFPNITLKVGNMDIVLNAFTYVDFPHVLEIDGKKYCPLAVHASKIGAQVLGNTFLMNNFVAFSKANQTVGIYQQYKPIFLGSYKSPLKKLLPFILGGGALLIVLIVLVIAKKRNAATLRKELNSDSNDVYSSRVGISN